MKLFIATIALAFASPFATASVMKAHLHATCEGVDFHSLTDAEKQFSSEALMLAYNQVHRIAGDGDKSLSGIYWDKEAEKRVMERDEM
jgi:hypothetical protein